MEVRIEKWKLKSNTEICSEVDLEYEETEIGKLYSDKEKSLVLVPEKLLSEKYSDFSPLWLVEFTKFKFKGKKGWKLKRLGKLEEKGEKGKISLKEITGEEKERIWITDENPFENYIGKSEIVFENININKTITLPIEVVSKKLIPEYRDNQINTKSQFFYPEFSKNLINDVWRLISALPFNIETPVSVSSGFSTGAPHKIFTFFFLKNYAEELEASLNIIRANPYRILSEEEEFVNINEVSEIDSDTIYNILTHPEYLCECEKGFEVNGKYYAPLKLLQSVKYETLDTPENRFVLYFVKLLLRDTEDLMKEIEEIFKEEKNEESGETKKKIKDLKGLFEDFVKDPVWEEVGELFIFPSTSTVLRMRNGYRELYSLYLKYLFSRKPFEKIQEAIDLRKVYDLYEFWCALKLCEIFNEFNKEKNEININPDDKIPETFKMNFDFTYKDKSYRFYYQKSRKSYSGLYLRPDFSIYENGEPLLLFDSKFAFDAKIMKNEEDEMEKAEKENRFPKTGDIIKMHAYKDALKAKACIVLYPGDESKFYKEEGTVSNFEDKDQISKILEENLKGIGWISFYPENSEKGEK